MVTVTYHGEWEKYTPDSATYWNPAMADLIDGGGIIFYRRLGDHKDLYEIRGEISPNNTIITVSTASTDVSNKVVVRSVSKDGMIADCDGLKLFAIEGYEEDYKTLSGKWINTTTLQIENAPVIVTVPFSVTPAQAKIALYNMGILDEVEAAVENHPYRPVQIYFSNATAWERANPYVIGLGYEIGLTDTEMDNLFILAATL